MNYFLMIMNIMPIVGIVTLVLYGLFSLLKKNRREKPANIDLLYEFMLIGWLVMFLYITQVMSFGNGMGARYNLIPLAPVFKAIEYGSVNAGMAAQILLNIFMFMPLGLLLPLLDKKRFGGFLPVFGISLGMAVLTEGLQFFTGRNADIDDVIANTTGGVLGFTLYVFGVGILYAVKTRRQGGPLGLARYPLNLVISILIVLLAVSPLALIQVKAAQNEFGYVYYGHAQPTNIEIPPEVSDLETTADVYRNIQIVDRDALAADLLDITGFDCKFEEVGFDTLQCLNDADHQAIFIFKYNTWNVLYAYGEDTTPDSAKLPTDPQALELAKTVLEKFHISSAGLVYDGLNEAYGDINRHLIFTDITSTRDRFVWGRIEMTIGEEGKLLQISDGRTYHEFVKSVETISPRASVDIARSIGIGEWDGTAAIQEIEPSYYFNTDTGYLIPTWQIHAAFVNDLGQEYDWSPNIGAVK